MERFAHFDKTDFPIIRIKFNSGINNIKEYHQFERDWLSCYMNNKEFVFLFDTTNVGYVNPLYAYNLSNFIYKLKNELKSNLLKYSIIKVSNWYVKHLLNITFLIQSPVAPVYLVEENINMDELHNDIENKNIIKDENIFFINND